MSIEGTQLAARSYDLAIVGGGLVGLATAREFLRRQPGLRLVLLEKEAQLAQHQSGHNSGVLHTGIYYKPGSLKAKACVEGHRALIAYCQERGIPYELSGKVIVALDESELMRLDDLYQRGLANGVQGLEMIDAQRLREIEPYAAGIRAIWSPTTGIVDYAAVARAYAEDVRAGEGEIVTGAEVVAMRADGDETRLVLGNGSEISARFVVTCAGLYADKVAKLSGNAAAESRIVPFRGDYYVLHPDKRYLVRSMIYPVPDPNFPFLGVHFTRRMDSAVWAGPNAVLAFAREGYGRWQIKPKELAEVLGYGGFRRLALKYWRTGASEMFRDYVKAAYVRELQRYIPALRNADVLPGPSGVRAQALAPDGALVDDFIITHGTNVVHVQNAPSPAATSSLMIARHIVDAASRTFALVPSL